MTIWWGTHGDCNLQASSGRITYGRGFRQNTSRDGALNWTRIRGEECRTNGVYVMIPGTHFLLSWWTGGADGLQKGR